MSSLQLPQIPNEEAQAVVQAWADKYHDKAGNGSVRGMATIVQKFFERFQFIPPATQAGMPVALLDPLHFAQGDQEHHYMGESSITKFGNDTLLLYHSPKDGKIGAGFVTPRDQSAPVSVANISNIIEGMEAGFIPPGRQTNILGLEVINRPDISSQKLNLPGFNPGQRNSYGEQEKLHQAFKNTFMYSQKDGYYIKLKIPIGLPKDSLGELLSGLLPIVQKTQTDNFKRFMTYANPDIVKVMNATGNDSFDAYNYLMAAGETGRNRRDAIVTYPFLGHYIKQERGDRDPQIVIHPIGDDPENKKSHIDYALSTKGASLSRVLAESYGSTEAVMKRLVGTRGELFKHLGKYIETRFRPEKHGGELLPYLLASIDINKVPFCRKEPEEFQALIEVIGACCEVLKLRFGDFTVRPNQKATPPSSLNQKVLSPNPFPKEAYASLMNNIDGKLVSIVKTYGGQAGQLFQAGVDVRDIARAVAEVLVYPMIGRIILDDPKLKISKIDHQRILNTLIPPTMDALFGKDLIGKGLDHILATSVKWHAQEGTLEDKIRDIERKGKWAALIPETPVPEYVMPGEVKFVALTNAEELKSEGRRMDHCVGGYADRCQREPYHILSLRDKSGLSIATLEIREPPPKSKEKLKVAQFRGIKNATPSEDAQKALQWLMGEINAERIPINLEEINRQRQLFNRADQQVLDVCGFDPKNPEKCNAAFMRYKELDLLPKKIRSLDEFLNNADLQKAAEQIISGIREGLYDSKYAQRGI